MIYKFTIKGKLAGLNELIDAERTHRKRGANLKRENEDIVRWCIRSELKKCCPKPPVFIRYHFVESDKRRDKDNIASFAHKVVQDALVKEHIIDNDGWSYIEGFSDSFSVDKGNPRIEVEIVDGENNE